jgi:glucan phosphoethanolaminetransferase (alkaline phosphatase superfamily)
MTLCLLMPDFLMKLFFESNKGMFHIAFTINLFLLSITLSFCKNRVWPTCFLILLCLLEIMQHGHMAYFGTPINPTDLIKIYQESNEIIETGCYQLINFWFVCPLIMICYGLAIWVLYLFPKRLCFSYAFLIVLILSLKALLSGSYKPHPNIFYPSLYNTLNTFSCAILQSGQNFELNYQFAPYQVEKHYKTTPQNIILIVGESLRFDHLSLFDYHRKTTPFLDSLKNHPNFDFKKTISSGTITRTSIPMFFNLVREPGNLDLVHNKIANLFRLAKENGYKTFWLSSQELALLQDVAGNFIDQAVTSNSLVTRKNRDEHILSLFRDLSLGKKNFIVIHQRTPHEPYEKQYKHRKRQFEIDDINVKDRHERTTNTYDNAVRFYDFLIQETFQIAQQKMSKDFYILFTSDHGELLGEQGLYGHNHLNLPCAFVPFWIYGDLKRVQNHLQNRTFLNHYQIGILVADLLGYNIHNPNDDGKTYYIHGNNIYSNYSYLEYEIIKNDVIMKKITRLQP